MVQFISNIPPYAYAAAGVAFCLGMSKVSSRLNRRRRSESVENRLLVADAGTALRHLEGVVDARIEDEQLQQMLTSNRQ